MANSYLLKKYNRRNSQEKVSVIVTELNKLLSTDFSLIAFDALDPTSLLQIVYNVLCHFTGEQSKPIQNQINNALIYLLKTLNRVRYDPIDIDPKNFREGLISGNKLTIYPILYWVLTNQAAVEKNYYLSKFVMKLEVPLKIFDDPEFQDINTEYSAVISKFWLIYKQNSTQKKFMLETQEVLKDINLIKKDISNLSLRLNMQWEKINTIHKKEMFLSQAKAFQIELSRYKKLQEQLSQAQKHVNEMDEVKKKLRQSLDRKKMMRLLRIDHLCQLQEDKSINKIIFVNQLPKELIYNKRVLDICQYVAKNETPQTQENEKMLVEIAMLTREIDNLNLTISCRSSEANLDLFKKQACALTSKKKDISKEICQLQASIQNIDNRISEKNQQFYDIIGGEMLYGQKLRDYVNLLKEQSTVYRNLKPRLTSISTEAGVAARTLDILRMIDPSIEENPVLQKQSGENQEYASLSQLKKKCSELTTEIDHSIAELSIHRETLTGVKSSMSIVEASFDIDKEEYNKATCYLICENKIFSETIDATTDKIKTVQEKLNNIKKEVGKKEQLFVSLSEDFINNFDDEVSDVIPVKEVYLKKLMDLERIKIEQIENKNKQDRATEQEEQQYSLLHQTYMLLMAKCSCD